ncbi:hypothetical protein F5884DRAFT_251465 [Xylogone sp. PMI_703]|nr:hypothetical protein F5884DRAFT_251465 [Xylogone sp. PMI_703]
MPFTKGCDLLIPSPLITTFAIIHLQHLPVISMRFRLSNALRPVFLSWPLLGFFVVYFFAILFCRSAYSSNRRIADQLG